MLKGRVRLDHKGIGQIAKSNDVRAAVNAAAGAIASSVQAISGVATDVQSYTTDRAGAGIAVLGGDAEEMGRLLVSAAKVLGLDVTVK